MPKLEKNVSLERPHPRLTKGFPIRDEAIDITTLLAENESLRYLAAEILLQSDLLREKLRRRQEGGLH
jgi:hypothetical protein